MHMVKNSINYSSIFFSEIMGSALKRKNKREILLPALLPTYLVALDKL